MVETFFAATYPASERIATARAFAMAARYRLPYQDRADLRQEALLELWRKSPLWDVRRSSWPTFAERVVANKLSSVMRSKCSRRAGALQHKPLTSAIKSAAPRVPIDLSIDVRRMLAAAAPFDRSVADCLFDNSPAEASRELGVGRTSVYRAIERLRGNFTAAGLGTRATTTKRRSAHV